jgi:hypothetical protein
LFDFVKSTIQKQYTMVGIEVKVTVLHGRHGGKFKLTLFPKTVRHFKLRPIYSGQNLLLPLDWKVVRTEPTVPTKQETWYAPRDDLQ